MLDFSIFDLLFILISFCASVVCTYFLYPRLKRAGMIGKDINKPSRPEVAEMGGIAIVAGITAGLLTLIAAHTFFGFDGYNLVFILAALITAHSVAFIGLVDDLIDIPQKIKAFVPLVAAIPLIVVKAAGSTEIVFPLIGAIDFGILYVIVLIPLAIAVCSNLTNMLAGFNGMESGMGAVMFFFLSILALLHGKQEMFAISASAFGALLGFLIFNKYPSKIFPGDVGNLTIGAVVATAVIIGNFESAGIILMIPYVLEFIVKAKNRFPSSGWWGQYKDGKLYSPEKPVGLGQIVMKLFNGISEPNLALFFIAFEAVFGITILIMFH